MAALGTALTLALWPEHVYRSQEARFYALAGFFACLALMFGARAIRGRGRPNTVLSCLFSLLAALSHTLMAILFPLVLGGQVIASAVTRSRLLRDVWLIHLVSAGAFLVLFLFFLLPLISGWNTSPDAETGTRVWIVLERTRSGHSPEFEEWLHRCAARRFQARKRRFDYAEHAVDVFLYEAESRSQCLSDPGAPRRRG